jgi:transcriptional regulator with PAS, ATPase and Fis domain
MSEEARSSGQESSGQSPSAKGNSGPRSFRWQALFQRACEPVFVLDRRRRLLFLNTACEQLLGLTLDRSRGIVCRRLAMLRPEDTLEERVGHLLAPPADAREGRFVRSRRLFQQRRGNHDASTQWVDLDFFPLRQDAQGGVLIVGRLRVVTFVDQPRPEMPPLPEKLEQLRQRRISFYTLELLTGRHPALPRLREQVRFAARVPMPVLILGERGSGRKTVARIIHHLSLQSEKALAVLDARKLPAAAIADVLFLERSSSLLLGLGAIHLIEPSRLPRELQTRLVEWLQIESSIRLIVSTQGDLEQEHKAGRLLPELYWRLGTVTLQLPPLRERRDDLAGLIEHFLLEAGSEDGNRVTGLGSGVLPLLQGYSWPGNLTELSNVVTEAYRRTKGDTIELAHLPMRLRLAQDAAEHPIKKEREIALDATLEQIERRLIRIALERAQGNRSRAAALLSMPRGRFLRRMEALGLQGSDKDDDSPGAAHQGSSLPS